MQVRMLWAAAFTLGVCAVVALVIAVVLDAGHGAAGAAAAGVMAAVLLLVTLAVLRLRHSAADSAAAEWERHAGQWQQYAEDLERRDAQRQARDSMTAAALEKAVDHLVRVQLPAALNPAGSQPSPGVAASGNGEVAALFSRVTATAAEGASALRKQLDDQIESYRLAVVTLARRVQASAHRIQEEATRMAARHTAPDVLASSMQVDHAAAQQARHAQSLAVLCGEWPGQQWPQPLSLVDVVRAAAGRIVAYPRVKVSGEPDVAVTASAVEPLIHLIAELLANATQSSPPTTQVLVTVRTVQRGAVIEMDDGGVGMEEHRLERARLIISGRQPLTLGDLGEVPQTGMAVIGRYVRRHGFRVDLAPSPYGGVRAVVLVPAEIVETLEPETPRPPRAVGTAVAAAPAGLAAADLAGTGSLPQRRSRRGVVAPDEVRPAGHGALPQAEPAGGGQTPAQAGQWMAAFFSGSAGEAGAATATPLGHEDSTSSEQAAEE
jgi:signal transduction histidine kinase